MNLFPLVVAGFSVYLAVGVPGMLYFRWHPETAHTRLAWWFVWQRTPAPGPLRFFLSSALGLFAWGLNLFVVDVHGLHWRAPAWLLILSGAVMALSAVALVVNLANEWRRERRLAKRSTGSRWH